MTRTSVPAPDPPPGFVAGGPAFTLPAQFVTEMAPEMDAAAMLLVLRAFLAIRRHRAPIPCATLSALAADDSMRRVADPVAGSPDAVAAAARRACDAGVLIGLDVAGDSLLFVNDEGGRRARERVQAGAVAPPPPARFPAPLAAPDASAGPMRAYESEIGLITPHVAALIRDARERYPDAWIVDAIHAATLANARSWNYIAAVLMRRSEGEQVAGSPASRSHGRFASAVRRAPAGASPGPRRSAHAAECPST